MASARWTSSTSDEELRFEVDPVGFIAEHRTRLLWAVGLLVSVGPLGGFGLHLVRTESQLSLWLRAALACVSAAAIALPLWYGVKAVLQATLSRHRIRVLPGGVFVERGIWRPSRTWWLEPLAAVITREYDGALILRASDERGAPAVAIVCQDAGALRQAIEAGKRSLAAQAGATGPPATESFDLAMFLGSQLRGLLRGLRRPTPFVVLDLGVLTATMLLAHQVQSLDLAAVYPSAYLLFVLGVGARRLDGGTMAELARRKDSVHQALAYVGAGAIMALPGVIVTRPLFGLGLGFLVALIVMIGLHVWLVDAARPARRPAPSGSQRAFNFLLALTLVPIGVLHESVIFEFAADAARDLGPFGLALLPILVLFGYWPIRIHAVIADPDDRSNVLWFWITVVALSLFALLTVADGWGPGRAHREREAAALEDLR